MTDSRHDPLAMHPTSHSFDVVLRGYDKSQVAETIEQLEADFRIALADRDAAVTRSADLASQLSAMHGEIESLRRKAAHAQAPTFENISERIQHMLQLAEEEAGEIRRAAEMEAHAERARRGGRVALLQTPRNRLMASRCFSRLSRSRTPRPSSGARVSTPTLPWCRLRCTSEAACPTSSIG